jgi:hypothetical protein
MSVLDHEEARESLALAEAMDGSLGLPLAGAWAHCAAADLALAAGEHGAAAERAIASADCAERAGAVIEEAQSRTLAGQALALAGDRERAMAKVQCAGDGARRLRRAAPAQRRRARAAQARAPRAPALALTALASTRSPSASTKSPPSSSTAGPTPRSPPNSSSAPRRSRRTCATSSASSTSPRASSWHAQSNARAARPEIRVLVHGLRPTREPGATGYLATYSAVPFNPDGEPTPTTAMHADYCALRLGHHGPGPDAASERLRPPSACDRSRRVRSASTDDRLTLASGSDCERADLVLRHDCRSSGASV